MQNYKDLKGGVHFLSDADIANGGEVLLPVGCVEITQAEAGAIAAPTAAQLWNGCQDQAKILLNDNDVIAIRCWKAGVPYPAEWLAYDIALRAIVHAVTGDPTLPLPTQPLSKPAGT